MATRDNEKTSLLQSENADRRKEKNAFSRSKNASNAACCRDCNKTVKVSVSFIISSLVLSFIVTGGYFLFKEAFKPEIKIPGKSLSIQFGDEMTNQASALLSYSPGITTVTISVDRSVVRQDIQLTAYTSTTKPLLSIRNQLGVMTIPFLEGPSRFNYNYYPSDDSIYLNPGSSIKYLISVFSFSNSTNASSIICSLRLFLFKDRLNYNRFQSRRPFKAVAFMEHCSNESNSTFEAIFAINQTASYYVAIEIEDTSIVTSNVTVISTQYSTTGMLQPNDCKTALMITEPSCTIKLCDHFYCSQTINTYILLVSNGYIKGDYTLVNSEVTGEKRLVELIFGCILAVIFALALLIIIIVVSYFIVRKLKSSHKETIHQ